LDNNYQASKVLHAVAPNLLNAPFSKKRPSLLPLANTTTELDAKLYLSKKCFILHGNSCGNVSAYHIVLAIYRPQALVIMPYPHFQVYRVKCF
jgi:hypothetical protein